MVDGTTLRSREVSKTRLLKNYSDWAIRLLSLCVVLGCWELIGAGVNPIFLSQPTRVVAALWSMVVSGTLAGALGVSLLALGLGFAAAVVVGVPLGILMGRSHVVEVAIDPYVNALYATPTVALIPLLLIWFGLGLRAEVVVIFLASIFPIIVNSFAGVKSISQSWVDTARAFNANERQVLREVVLPGSVPFVMAGLRLGIGHSVIGLIVAQMFLALAGLGKLLVNYGDYFQTDYVLATVVVVALLGVVLTAGVKALEHRFAHWKKSERAY